MSTSNQTLTLHQSKLMIITTYLLIIFSFPPRFTQNTRPKLTHLFDNLGRSRRQLESRRRQSTNSVAAMADSACFFACRQMELVVVNFYQLSRPLRLEDGAGNLFLLLNKKSTCLARSARLDWRSSRPENQSWLIYKYYRLLRTGSERFYFEKGNEKYFEMIMKT